MQINIRKYQPADFPSVSKLFCETIKCINIQDYTYPQCKAWIEKSDSLNNRRAQLITQRTLIAEINKTTVGFGSIDDSGHLDLLYVHKDFQHIGIAAALCDSLEKGFEKITTYSSLTAKPFFEKRGYYAVKTQKVICLDLELINYYMVKNNDPVR